MYFFKRIIYKNDFLGGSLLLNKIFCINELRFIFNFKEYIKIRWYFVYIVL